MDSESNISKSQQIMHNYDEEHDSDIESRLYAEIYFCNNVEGERMEVPNSVNNNDSLDHTSSMSTKPENCSTLICDKTAPISLSETNHLNNIVSNQRLLTLAGMAMNNVGKLSDNISMNMESNDNTNLTKPQDSIHNISENENSNINTSTPNKSNISIKSRKRLIHDNHNELNLHDEKSNKKKKNENKNINVQTKGKSSHGEFGESSTPISNIQTEKNVNSQTNGNKIINPYNKQVRNDPRVKIQPLLSQGFINLLFGTNKNKNQKANKLTDKNMKNKKHVKKNDLRNNLNAKKIKKQSAIEKTSPSNIVQNSETKITENEMQLIDDVIFVDSTSGSSENSVESNSKYNMDTPTDKKLVQGPTFEDSNTRFSLSDSEESVFEVPVPPKPRPLMIDLDDSNSNDSSSNDSNEESNDMLKNTNSSYVDVNTSVSFSEVNTIENKNKCTDNTIIISDTMSDIHSENEESSNLILNCTEIQYGCSSLSEIKERSHQSISAKESNKEIHTAVENTTEEENLNSININNMDNIQSMFNNSATKNKSISTMNTLCKKKKIKNSSSNRQDIPMEDYFFQPMTDEMKSFYNDSWGGEYFDIDQLKSKMSRDPDKWAILDTDLMPSFSRRKRYFGIVCTRCQKEGHRQNTCPEPYREPVCHMCGIKGHFQTGCPHKKCLTCGKRQMIYRKTCENCTKMVCSRCTSQGHTENSCPDLWRRYHNIINNYEAKVPSDSKNVMKPKYQLICCNCTKRGHDSSTCKRYRWSEHFSNPSHVTNYNGPDYYTENLESSMDISMTYESSFNETTHNSSLNLSGFYNNSINLDKTYTESPNLNKSKRKSIKFQHNFLTDQSSRDDCVIFEMHSKHLNESHKLETTILKLQVPDLDSSSNLDNWSNLVEFLNFVVSHISSCFVLQRFKKRIEMVIQCHSNYIKLLSNLIEQYASRSNFERSFMFTNCDRSVNNILKNLDIKVAELFNLKEDPLKLFEETRRLIMEFSNYKNGVSDLRNSLTAKRWAESQKKLIMLLYKEGCADTSFKKLKKLAQHLTQTQMKYTRNKSKKKPKMGSQVSYTDLFNYLHYYNNIFVPYEPKKIYNYIRKYKQYKERINRLKNNPILFPRVKSTIAIENQNEEIKIQDNSTKEVVGSDNFQMQATTSQLLPLPSSTLACQIPSPFEYTNTSISTETQPLLSENTSIRDNIHSPKELPCNIHISIPQNEVFSTPTTSEGIERDNLQLKCLDNKNNLSKTSGKKMKKFIKNTRKFLLGVTKSLLAPHLQKQIKVLEKKLENTTDINFKDVQRSSAKLRASIKRQNKKQR